MHLHRTRLILSALLLSLFVVRLASAKDKLVVYGEKIVVYTGPGKLYRPLTILSADSEVQYAPQIVKTDNAEFYKVIVRLSHKKKAIGYIPVDAQVRKKNDSEVAEDIDSFEEFPLAQKAIQVTYTQFKTQRALATVGHVHYLGPGFYIKEFAGAFRAPKHTVPLLGLEFGNDALLHKNLSGFISYGAGFLWRPTQDSIFPGNKDDFSNLLIQAALGIRLNFGSSASVALGGTQATFFSANNSLVTWGLIAIFEMGL